MASFRGLRYPPDAGFLENQRKSSPPSIGFPLGGARQEDPHENPPAPGTEAVPCTYYRLKLTNVGSWRRYNFNLNYHMRLWNRIKGRYRRDASRLLSRRLVRMRNHEPIITFTFDDFPRSALYNAAPAFRSRGIKATYYASFGLMGKTAPTGEIFHREDLKYLLAEGHEIGCHTFDHYDAFETHPDVFEASVQQNQSFFKSVAPGRTMKTLSYPISGARPSTKGRCANYFIACRSGGQTFNSEFADLNGLRAFFLEQCSGDFAKIRSLIDANFSTNGWLILATHDVSDTPTRYGCPQAFFEEVVEYAKRSGSAILPMEAALNLVS